MSSQSNGKDKKTITVVLTDRFHERSFLTSGVLKELSGDYNLVLVKDRKVVPDSSDEEIFSKIYIFDLQPLLSKRTSTFLSEVLRWRHRAKSISFLYRESRYRPSLTQALKSRRAAFKREETYGFLKDANLATEPLTTNLFELETFWKKNYERFKWIFLLLAKKYFARLFAYNPFFLLLCFVERPNTIKSKELEDILVNSRAELIIVPTGGMTVTDREIINIAEKHSVITFYIFDNWDNLSSKTILWNKPDFIGTWGPQATLHAINIQGISSSKIIELGSARFSNYREVEAIKPLNFPKEFALFLGVQQDYDEIRALSRLEDEIVSHQEIYGDLFIVYRPYPGGHQAKEFNQDLFSRVILDPQLVEFRIKDASIPLKYTDLNYYPSILKNASIIVGGYTTMLLESCFFSKIYLAPAYEESGNLTSPFSVRNNYEHLRGIDSLPNLVICEDFEDLGITFRSCFQGEHQFSELELNSSLSYFVNPELELYGNRLMNAVSKIMNEKY